MPFLNQKKGGGRGGVGVGVGGVGNDHRNDFMINLHENYVPEMGFELATPGSAVRRVSVCAMKSGF